MSAKTFFNEGQKAVKFAAATTNKRSGKDFKKSHKHR